MKNFLSSISEEANSRPKKIYSHINRIGRKNGKISEQAYSMGSFYRVAIDRSRKSYTIMLSDYDQYTKLAWNIYAYNYSISSHVENEMEDEGPAVDRKNFLVDMIKNSSIDVRDFYSSLAKTYVKNHFGYDIEIGSFYIELDSYFVFKFFKKYCKDFAKICLETQFRSKYVSKDDFIYFTMIDKGTFLYMTKGKYSMDKRDFLSNRRSTPTIKCYIFGHNATKYNNLLRKCLKRDQESEGVVKIFSVDRVENEKINIQMNHIGNRNANSFVYSFGEFDKICDHIDRFLSNSDFYKRKQINYKTGILLYSAPGTGKSSIVKALATKYGRSICSINVGSISNINFNMLTSMINNDDTYKYIILLEDIDTLELNRDVTDKNNGKSYADIVNGLLQFLDSNSSPNDVIFVATTNHIEKLDEALLRDGRFDLKLQVNGIVKEDISKMINILESNNTVQDVVEAYGKPGEDGLYNQSKLQNIIINMKGYHMHDEYEEEVM